MIGLLTCGLTPGVNGTITDYNPFTGYALVKSSDSSWGADNYATYLLEPARDVAQHVHANIGH